MVKDFGHRVRQLREKCELSQERLADLAGISRGWLVAIESGRKDPKLSYALKLAAELARRLPNVTVTDLFETDDSAFATRFTSGAPGTSVVDLQATSNAAGTAILDPVKRREVLVRTGIGVIGAIAPQLDTPRLIDALHYPHRVDNRVLEDLERRTRLHGREIHTASPAGLLPFIRLQLGDVTSLLSASQPDSIERRLLLVGGETAVIAGYLSYHLHNYGDAEGYFAIADRLARDARNEPLRAMGLVARSALYSSVPHGGSGGDPRFALTLLEEARSAASIGASPFLLTWLHSRCVEDFASCDEGLLSDRSLDLAARTFSKVHGRDDGFFYNWTPGRLTGYEGSAAVLLKRPQQAAAVVKEPLRRVPVTMPSERSFLLIVRGAAFADQGDVEGSCETLAEALNLAKEAGLLERIRRIKGVRRQHLPHGEDSPAVRDLDDQLLAA